MNQEKELVYDSLPAKIGLGACIFTIPIWGIIAPITITFISAAYIFGLLLGRVSNLDGLGQCFGLLILFLTGVVFIGIFKDNAIKVSADGLTVPAFLSLGNKLDRFIEWREIDKVVLHGDDFSNFSDLKLQICLRENHTIILSLKSLSANDIEYLLVSLSNFVQPRVLDERLDLFKETLWNVGAIAGSNGLSFTKMWEDELTTRFSASAYVPLNPGQKLQEGNLKVIRQLALGGWSAIYLVQEENTRLRVLKESVIAPGANQELKEKAAAMFLREAVLLMKINHPRIVRVHEHFIEDDRHYLLLDYIAGQNIRQLVKLQGPMHQLDVIEYALQLCDTLLYMHSQTPPIVHRDLTPDNMVLNNDAKLILVDFGAANEMIGTATGTLVGKQCYISPEQFRGKAATVSDIYALGASLFFMLTAVDPEPLAVSSPKAFEPATSLPLDQVIRALTAQDAEERPQSISEVKAMFIEVRDSSAAAIESAANAR